jgi:tetratricopeptide (TPR) repeat protein
VTGPLYDTARAALEALTDDGLFERVAVKVLQTRFPGLRITGPSSDLNRDAFSRPLFGERDDIVLLVSREARWTEKLKRDLDTYSAYPEEERPEKAIFVTNRSTKQTTQGTYKKWARERLRIELDIVDLNELSLDLESDALYRVAECDLGVRPRKPQVLQPVMVFHERQEALRPGPGAPDPGHGHAAEELRDALAMARRPGGARVIVVEGPDGAGKTRLAVGTSHAAATTLEAAAGTAVTAECLADMPLDGPVVVVADDAHRSPDLSGLAAMLADPRFDGVTAVLTAMAGSTASVLARWGLDRAGAATISLDARREAVAGPPSAARDTVHAAGMTGPVQLPGSVPDFTGRDGEMAVLAGLLKPAGPAGLVVVSAVAGLAGVGKTTLAVEAGHAASRRGWFRGGIIFLDLHGYSEAPVQPARALESVLRALGVAPGHVPPGLDDRAALYRSLLAQTAEPVLVIADNASAEAQVRPLLPGTGPHKVLVTSRHTLAGLGARMVDITVLDNKAAAALLEASLRAARPDDDRLTRAPETMVRLAQLCGGLPLALQITAALLKGDESLSPAELAGELALESDRLDLLRYDDGSGPAAPSVAAAFELSYRRLGEDEARMFRLLPVHPGPNISAEAAACLTSLPAGKARAALAGLARAHLAERSSAHTSRWRMHDLLRLYAQRLSGEHAEADQQEDGKQRLLRHYLDAADAADDWLQAAPAACSQDRFTSREQAIAWLDAEQASLAPVVVLAADSGCDDVASRLPIALARYFSWRRRLDDWLDTTRVSLDASRRLADRQREGIALSNLGAVLREMRRLDDAVASCKEAMAVFREMGDRQGQADTLNNLGSALHQLRRFEEVASTHREDLRICRELGNRRGQADALNNLGLTLREAGQRGEAISAHEEAASIYREVSDLHGEGSALNNLGAANIGMWPGDALPNLKRALAIFREADDRHNEAMVLSNIGMALSMRAQDSLTPGSPVMPAYAARWLEAAAAAQRDAAVIYRETGDRHGEGMAMTGLGVALTGMRRFSEAIRAHEAAVGIFRETRDRHGEGLALDNLGVPLRETLNLRGAVTVHQESAAIFRRAADWQAEAGARTNLGTALARLHRFNDAVAAFERARALYAIVGDRHGEYQVGDKVAKLRAARSAF